jgi:formylmethanofuran dehydrogenase subunit E
VIIDLPDPADRMLNNNPEEKLFKCDSCNDKGYHDEFDIDEDGELCNTCYKQNNLYNSMEST